MGAERKTGSLSALAFYHSDGLVPALQTAKRFAGKGGRIATLPDVIAARLATKPGTTPWERYFTTLSAEYVGRTKGGNRILVVAHGIGPMSTLDGILQAYGYEYKDKTRSRRGGRISQDEFVKLESGYYGPVEVVDLEHYVTRYQYPFMQILTLWQAISDRVVAARLGKDFQEYLGRHANFAREWHEEEAKNDPPNKYGLDGHDEYLERRRRGHRWYGARAHSNPYIITMDDAANCAYMLRNRDGSGFESYGLDRSPDMALAHLLSIGGLTHTCHDGYESLVCDVHAHEWYNGVRFVGVKGALAVTDIRAVVDPYEALRSHWRTLLRPTEAEVPAPGFFMVEQLDENDDDSWFTQRLKRGHAMDTGESEFHVESLREVGEPASFDTEIHGYYGILRYDLREAKRIAPRGANAYRIVGEPEFVSKKGDPTHHRITVQFYRAALDTSKSLPCVKDIENDYDLLVRLTEAKEAVEV